VSAALRNYVSGRRLNLGNYVSADTPLTPPVRAINIQHWSNWRRLHQGHARRSHYQHRLATELDPITK
jgi:hypothetical protein